MAFEENGITFPSSRDEASGGGTVTENASSSDDDGGGDDSDSGGSGPDDVNPRAGLSGGGGVSDTRDGGSDAPVDGGSPMGTGGGSGLPDEPDGPDQPFTSDPMDGGEEVDGVPVGNEPGGPSGPVGGSGTGAGTSGGRDPEDIEPGPASEDPDPAQGVEEGQGEVASAARGVEEEAISKLEEEVGREFSEQDVRVTSETNDGTTRVEAELTETGQQQVEFESFQRGFQQRRDVIGAVDEQTVADLTAGDDFTVSELDGQIEADLTPGAIRKEARASVAQREGVDVERVELSGNVGDLEAEITPEGDLPGVTDVSPGLTTGTAVGAEQTDRFESQVSRFEDFTGTDLPGEGDILGGPVDVSEEVEEFTGVGLPDDLPTEAQRALDVEFPGERDLLNKASDAIAPGVSAVEEGLGAELPGDGRLLGGERVDVSSELESRGVPIPSGGDLVGAAERAAGTDVPFTDTEFQNAESFLPSGENPAGTNSLLFEGGVEARQQLRGTSESEARASLTADVEAVDEGTVDSFSPAVGRNPLGGVRAARGIAGIGAIAGGAAAVNELGIPEGGEEDQSELEVGSGEVTEIEAVEPSFNPELTPSRSPVDITEVGVPEQSDSVDLTLNLQSGQLLQEQEEVDVPEELLPEDEFVVDEDFFQQGRPGGISGRGGTGQRLNRDTPGGISEIGPGPTRDPAGRVEQSQQREVFQERSLPESVVPGEGTATEPVEATEATEALEQSQRSELLTGTGQQPLTDVRPVDDATTDIGSLVDLDSQQSQGVEQVSVTEPQLGSREAVGVEQNVSVEKAQGVGTGTTPVDVEVSEPFAFGGGGSPGRPRRPRDLDVDVDPVDDDEEDVAFEPFEETFEFDVASPDEVTGGLLSDVEEELDLF